MSQQALQKLRRHPIGDRVAPSEQCLAALVHHQQALSVLEDRGVVELPRLKAWVVANGVGIDRIPVTPVEGGDLVAVHPQLQQALIGLPLPGLALLQQQPALLPEQPRQRSAQQEPNHHHGSHTAGMLQPLVPPFAADAAPPAGPLVHGVHSGEAAPFAPSQP